MSTNPPGHPSRPLHLLVTAGPTREKIDDVRDWGNIFTGNTGLEIARAFLQLGHVTLLTSNEQHARHFDGYSGTNGMLGIELFKTHADLLELLRERMTSGEPVDAVAMTAAVADYRPTSAYRVLDRQMDPVNLQRETWTVENVSAGKVKSTHEHLAILGERTLKLVDQFRGLWAYQGLLIKFKLEVGLSDEELIRVAEASRLASRADLIVANTLAMARPTDGSPGAAYILGPVSRERVTRDQLPAALVQWVKNRLLA